MENNMNRFSAFALCMLLLGVTVFADDSGDDIKVPPRGKVGHIQVITDPANSNVYLGGKLLGKSPINDMEVPSGRQTLVITDQGYELVNIRFNVWPDSLNTYDAKTVIPKGGIDVTTIPGKCSVLVDGDAADYTDGGELTLKNVDAGDHLITAKCGNKSKDALVKVLGEQTVKVTIDVTKKK